MMISAFLAVIFVVTGAIVWMIVLRKGLLRAIRWVEQRSAPGHRRKGSEVR